MMKKYKLSELLEIRNGKDHKALNDGEYPVYGSGGIMRYVDEYLYDKESILLPRKGSLTNIQYANEPFWTVDTLYYTEVKSELTEPYYLYCYLKLLDLSGLDSGTGVPSMTFDSYYNISVFLPPLSEQKKIAAVLSSFDRQIALCRSANETLEAMAKQLYDYWFVQFDFPGADGKPYKSSSGKMVYNAQLKREIPEGWELKSVKECIEHINTGLNPRDNFVLNTGDIKYITVKNLTTEGTIDFSTCDTIDESAREIVHKRSDIKKGDILFASIAPLGRCYILQENPTQWDINESVFSIRPKLKKVSSEYLYLFFMSQYFVKKAELFSTGSVFSGIRISVLENMELLLPNEEIMNLFTEKVKSIFSLKDNNNQQISSLTRQRNELLPLLMNGQVEVK